MAARELKCCTISFVIYCIGVIAFVGGFLTPFWYATESDLGELLGYKKTDHVGPFWMCSSIQADFADKEECEWHDQGGLDGWWKACVGLLITAGILELIAGCFAMILPVSAILQIVGGLTGITGNLYFILKIHDVTGDKLGIMSNFDDIDNIVNTRWMWGFYIAMVGASLLVLNGIVLIIVACVHRCNMHPLCCCCCGKRRYIRRLAHHPQNAIDDDDDSSVGGCETLPKRPPPVYQPPVYRSVQV